MTILEVYPSHYALVINVSRPIKGSKIFCSYSFYSKNEKWMMPFPLHIVTYPSSNLGNQMIA